MNDGKCIYCGQPIRRKDGSTCGGPCAGAHRILNARCPTSVARCNARDGNLGPVAIAAKHAAPDLAVDLRAIMDGTYIPYDTRKARAAGHRCGQASSPLLNVRSANHHSATRPSGDIDLDFASDFSSNDHRADRIIRAHAKDAGWLRRLADRCTGWPNLRDRAILADYLHRQVTGGQPLIKLSKEIPHVAN